MTSRQSVLETNFELLGVGMVPHDQTSIPILTAKKSPDTSITKLNSSFVMITLQFGNRKLYPIHHYTRYRLVRGTWDWNKSTL